MADHEESALDDVGQVEIIDPDPLGRRIREQKALLSHSKRQVAQRLRDNLFVPPSAILSLTRAEVQLANLESYARLQELTRG